MPHPHPVLLLSRSVGPGGGERQMATTALSLDRARYTPHVAYAETGFWAPILEHAGIRLHWIRSRSLMSRRGVTEMARLRAYIGDHGIRIVQPFDYATNVYAIPIARSVRGVAALSNLRCHMDLIPPRDRRLNYLSHRLASAVVVNSNALRTHLVEDYRIASEKIHVCYNGLDTSTFRPGARRRIAELEGKALVIGTVCVLRPEKNLPLLLKSFAAVAPKLGDVALLVVGSGPEEASLRQLAATLGIGGQCVFQSSVRDVVPYLHSIDIFVLPSVTEGLSNSIMEALACGCCVIASNVGGTPELIDHGVNGLLFPSGDLQALTTALASVAGDASLRATLSQAGAAQAQSRFSVAAAAARMQEIYDTVLGIDSVRR
jgi:L-malate glycosyltransferase